ncbi:MAG TPA: hypothetical protein VK791_04680 [bacterium]|jgi:hypothetical protein|nr:hypothetical protein [bacterium]
MKTLTRLALTFLLSLVFLSTTNLSLLARETATPTATVDESAETKTIKSPSSTIVIHKPATDPAWGKVIQYQSEISALNHEVLHKFLFQDSKGIVRNAVYHENSSENGYWEVWVWDQP